VHTVLKLVIYLTIAIYAYLEFFLANVLMSVSVFS